MARQHGIITTITGLTGSVVLNNLTYSNAVEISEARNEKGYITDRKAYSKKTTVRGDGLLDAGEIPVTAIDSGATITISDKEYLVESCDITESNTDYAKISFSAVRADECTVEGYKTPSAESAG